MLGCLIHYIHTSGTHPFEEDPLRVLNDESTVEMDDLSTRVLIKHMLHPQAHLRPTTAQSLQAPAFWARGRVVSLVARLREALEWNKDDAGEKIAAATRKAEKRISDLTDKAPADVKARLQQQACDAKNNKIQIEAEMNVQEKCNEDLKQRLEDSVSECEVSQDLINQWDTKVPSPPSGQWKKAPKAWPKRPLFSLVIHIRNADCHTDQLIESGNFEDKAHMHQFYEEKFPWLKVVLYHFLDVHLRIVAQCPAQCPARGARRSFLDIVNAFAPGHVGSAEGSSGENDI